jgi:PAS domain S-box-containing protein
MAEIPTFPDPIEISTLARALQRSQASMLAALAERSQARDWLNNLIQSIVEGVVTFDQQGRITFLSQGAEVLLGQDSATALGRSINDLLPLTEGDDGQFSDHIPAPGGKSQIGVLTHDNKPVVLSITGAQLIPPNGETPQVALVLRDVTQEETARRLHSYFLANISHEFLTPLSTLNAAVELLMHEAETMSPTEIRELLKPTYLSLLGLQTLIDNLLQSSRIEAGQFTLKRQPVDLNQIIAGALAIVQPLFERRRQTFAVSEPAEPVVLSADPTRLTQVLINLLSNAGKYSPPNQAIDLRIERRGDRLRLAVADRGSGIAPGERANLFRRFIQMHSAEHEQYGIGLGLYVVKTTVEAHGGQVGSDDRPGGGSIFWLELPLTVNEEDV